MLRNVRVCVRMCSHESHVRVRGEKNIYAARVLLENSFVKQLCKTAL